MAKTISLGILALLLVAVGVGSYAYVSERESYFVDRNFRLLALWSKKLSETVEEYKHQFQYLIGTSTGNGDEPGTCGEANAQQSCQPVRCPKDANETGDDKIPFLCRFKKEFEKQNKQLEKKLILVSICSKPQKLPLNTFVNDQPSIKAQLFLNDKDRLRLTYEREYERKSGEAQQLCKKTVYKNGRCKGEKCKWIGKETIRVDLSISKWIRHLITDQAFNDTIIPEQAFSDIIIFNSETGTVHFQANHSSFRIDDFRDIVARRSDTGGFFSFFSESSDTPKIENNKSGSSKSLPLKHLLQNPTHQQMTIGDISYELFTQPIVLPELTIKKQTHYKQVVIATDVGATELTLQHYKKDDPARLILAGFVKTEKFQSEYRTIPHTWLLFFLLFVLLGLLSLPIIHLGFMDAHERLSRIHVFSLLATCISGTALLTLLFLDVVWLNNVRNNLDKQLEETAKDIKNEFSHELKKNLNLLHAYDRSAAFEDDFRCVTQGENCPVTYLAYPHDCAEEGDRKCGEGSNGRWVARKEYQYLCNEEHKELLPYNCDYDPVFWVDQKKNARINWSPKRRYYVEASVFLAHRDYVKEILKSKSSLWHTEEGHPAFYAQSLLSLEAGNHTVVFSMESSRPEGKPKKWVAAIETEFQFLKAGAIPDGTGFAVIEDDGGKVLFHSDDNRSLWENFFEETDDNAQLKAHVFSRTAGKAEGNYWGKGHSFYSMPLPDVPWSVVVFRNKELFRTTNFEALLLAVILFVLYVGISSIVPTAIWLFSKASQRQTFISWLWPDSDRPYCHYATIGFIGFLVGIPLFWCDIFTDDCAVWFVFSYPLVSLFVLCFLPWFWPGSGRPDRCYTSIALIFVLFFSGSIILFWCGDLENYAPWIILLNPISISVFLYCLTKVCPKCHPSKSPERLHCRYVCMIVSFLLLFSVLPMGTFFKIGTDREMTLAMKYNLITLGQKLRQTPDLDFSQIQREIRRIDTSRFITECEESECDAIKCERTNSQEEGNPLACPEQAVSRNDRTLSTHSIYLSLIANTSMYVSDHKPSPNSCCPPQPPLLEKIHKFIRKHSLSRLSNPVSVSTLGLIGNQSPGTPFGWRYESPTSIALDFQAPLKPKPSDSQNKWVILRSWSSSDIWPSSAKSFFWGAAVLIAFVLMLVGVPIFIVSRIFPVLRKSLVDENSYQEKNKENSNKKEERLLIIGSPESLDSYRQENLPAHRWGKIDCHLISDSLEWWKMKRKVLPIRKGKARVILDHFEYQFGVPQFDHAKLELLAALLAKVKQVCVLSTINPLKLAHKDDPGLSSPDESKHPVPKRPVPMSLQEWSQVFQTFTLQKGPAPVSLREWSRVFQLFTLQYASLDPKSTSTESDARPDLIPTYEAIWQARTMDEKITLHHLAQDGFVHAENPDLPHLFDLGLIKFNPDPRWLEDDFEKYVLNAAQRDGLDVSEREKRQGRWDVWKWPLAIVLIVLGMGLLLTQQEFKNVVVLMLSILPVLPSALSELFGSMGKAGKSP